MSLSSQEQQQQLLQQQYGVNHQQYEYENEGGHDQEVADHNEQEQQQQYYENQAEEEEYLQAQQQQQQQQQMQFSAASFRGQQQQQQQQQQVQQAQSGYYQNSKNAGGFGSQKVMSPTKSSQEVMQDVFEYEGDHNHLSQQQQQQQQKSFLLHQQQQQLQQQYQQQQQHHDTQQMQNLQSNLSRLRMSEDGNQANEQEQFQNGDGNLEQEQQEQEEGEIEGAEGTVAAGAAATIATSVDLAHFDESYRTFLSKIASDQAFVDASYEEKIDILLEYSTADEIEYRLGSQIFLFELVYNFRESLTDSAIALILTSIYQNIPLYYENKDFYVVLAALEIVALIGPHEISYSHIKLLASILIDEALPILQDKAFLALMNFSYPGYFALLDMANKDYNEIPIYILNKLAQTEEIQLSVIIPALQNDINMIGDSKKRIQSLCALNRMYSMIYKSNTLPILVNLLNEGTLDRQLIVSTIRACGEIGEATLLKIMKQTNNAKIKMAISTVLSWRVRSNEKSALGIRIVPYNIAAHFNVNPGTMCVYSGNMTPLAFVEPKDESEDPQEVEEDFIEINSRDFMAALQRLLAVKYDRFSQEKPAEKSNQFHDISSFVASFDLIKLIDPTVTETHSQPASGSLATAAGSNNTPSSSQSTPANTEPNVKISSNIIRALAGLLSDENAQVRETAVSTLGVIGLPEVENAADGLYAALNDSDCQVRAMAAWCIGKIGEANPIRVAKRLVALLKDNYWKVRTAACVSLGSMGPAVAEIAFPALTKVLKDGTINKVTVCESLVRLGVQGEQILVDLLKHVPQANFKLKTAIIQSFELANISRPTIDFVIEELFKNASDKMIEVRRACLQTLEILRNRALDSNITYLKSKNVLPLFYYFLQDPFPEIRQIALNSIASFGPQAELMFIEGLTKDKNATIRQECARGLGLLGVQNFRALLFGLLDANEDVRKATALSVKQNFEVKMIIEEFRDKPNQLPALLCNIKDIFSLPFYIDDEVRGILESILNAFGETAAVAVAAATSASRRGQQSGKNNYSFEQQQLQQQQQQQHQESVYSSSSKTGHSATHIPASKVSKTIPNMRGGMPAYTSIKPRLLVNSNQ